MPDCYGRHRIENSDTIPTNLQSAGMVGQGIFIN